MLWLKSDLIERNSYVFEEIQREISKIGSYLIDKSGDLGGRGGGSFFGGGEAHELALRGEDKVENDDEDEEDVDQHIQRNHRLRTSIIIRIIIIIIIITNFFFVNTILGLKRIYVYQ